MRRFALLALVLACRIPDEHFVTGDAGNPIDGSAARGDATDAPGGSSVDGGASACDDSQPFGSAVPVAGLPALASVARFSADELTAYFGLTGANGVVDLYQATRGSIDGSFGSATLFSDLVGEAGETTPYVSSDGLQIVYTSGSSATAKDIWYATREATDDTFGSGAAVPNANGLNYQDDYASLAANGDLWFSSKRGDAALEIYRAPLGSGGWGSGSAVAELESGSNVGSYYPVLTPDQLHIYFARLLTGTVPFTIYEATRSVANGSFSEPAPVSSLPSGSDIRPAWISPDDCRLYVGFGSAGAITMSMATRQ